MPRRSWHFVAVSVSAYGREKRWWRCRSGRVGSVWGGAFGGRSRTTACSCQRRNDATARRCEQVSHVLFPEWVGAAGAYEPSCDLQRAPRCGGAASLPSVRKGAFSRPAPSQIKSSTESKFSKPRPRRPGSSALAAALLTTFPPRVPSKLRRPSHEHHVHLSCEARNIVWRKTFEESCCKTESERCCKMQRQRRRHDAPVLRT